MGRHVVTRRNGMRVIESISTGESVKRRDDGANDLAALEEELDKDVPTKVPNPPRTPVEAIPSARAFECEFCEFSGASQRELNDHVAELHPDDDDDADLVVMAEAKAAAEAEEADDLAVDLEAGLGETTEPAQPPDDEL